MSLQKTPPYRSKKFLKFCHDETPALALCCLCPRRWFELHHFGDDGGARLKPSDNEVARVCVKCHKKNDFKRRALIKNKKLEILDSFQNDALKLNRAYVEKLEGR